MPKSQEYSIFTCLSLWSNRRKAINETYDWIHFVSYSYLPKALSPPSATPLSAPPFSYSANSLDPTCLLTVCCPSPTARRLSCTLMSSWNSHLLLLALLLFSCSPLEKTLLFSPISYKPKNPETRAYFLFLPYCNIQMIIPLSLPLLLLCILACSLVGLNSSVKKNRLKERG